MQRDARFSIRLKATAAVPAKAVAGTATAAATAAVVGQGFAQSSIAVL